MRGLITNGRERIVAPTVPENSVNMLLLIPPLLSSDTFLLKNDLDLCDWTRGG